MKARGFVGPRVNRPRQKRSARNKWGLYAKASASSNMRRAWGKMKKGKKSDALNLMLMAGKKIGFMKRKKR